MGANYVPGLKHPDIAEECQEQTGGQAQTGPATSWDPASEDSNVDPEEGDPGTPSISLVQDLGLVRTTVAQGSPVADPSLYDWWLEVSMDGVAWSHLGNYPIEPVGTTEIVFAVLFGTWARVRWVLIATEGTTDERGSASNEEHV